MRTINHRRSLRPIIIVSAVTTTALLAVAFAAAFAQTTGDLVHRDGFTRYARVDRSDGTWREMFIANETIETFRATSTVPTGAIILMESYRPDGSLSSVFMSRNEGQRWAYGSISPGEPVQSVRVAGNCASCHRLSQSDSAVFTMPMLESFSRTGEAAMAFCDRGGRSPCDAEVYEPSGAR